MLGFEILISREAAGPSGTGASRDVASWVAGLGGLRWLKALVEEGKAVLVAGNQGYPVHYTAVASAVFAVLANATAEDLDRLVSLERVHGTFNVGFDPAALAACPPEEQLTIEAWDLSS